MANYRSALAQRRRAEERAAALREAAAALRAEAGMEPDEMRMNRYVSPNAILGCPGGCGGNGCCGADTATALTEQLVELAVCRNQLLTDLLGAVNALTAAMLSAQSRT